jgi:hypothetical protein
LAENIAIAIRLLTIDYAISDYCHFIRRPAPPILSGFHYFFHIFTYALIFVRFSFHFFAFIRLISDGFSFQPVFDAAILRLCAAALQFDVRF